MATRRSSPVLHQLPPVIRSHSLIVGNVPPRAYLTGLPLEDGREGWRRIAYTSNLLSRAIPIWGTTGRAMVFRSYSPSKPGPNENWSGRSEEHTSELQSP